jgi:hypothetical protein
MTAWSRALWIGERDINAEMIQSGFAWVYRRYADDPAYCAQRKSSSRLAPGPLAGSAATRRGAVGMAQTQYAGRALHGLHTRNRSACVATLGK